MLESKSKTLYLKWLKLRRIMWITTAKCQICCLETCPLGYSDFHNLMGFTSKKMPRKNSLKCLLKKFFSWISHILRICILLLPNNTHICTPWPQNFFYFFFNIWVSKKRRILRWFQICGKNINKVYPEKVICQKLLQVSSIEEDKLQLCTLLFL